MPVERRWFVPDPAALRWHPWQSGAADEFVVFNPRSGETHHLNLVAALILQSLMTRPATRGEVVDEVRRALPAETDESIFRQIPALIEEFDAVGLVTPTDL